MVKDRLECVTGLELELRIMSNRGGEFGVVIYLSALPDLGWKGAYGCKTGFNTLSSGFPDLTILFYILQTRDPD